ncbi:hypothetical protein CRM22_006689 [Opisthorchis felineus]|uniref:MutL C-terminal dimerisation domain-containing protein n=1 Tax=Opisthorchis felineus TaxID=147828 RepID=A0A4S2LJP1_OPIFE|nr:hypothetical protein CRM22_006689 [Opisthorchis felineus]
MASQLSRSRIHALEDNVIHRICSGQVVVTLASAVKELVENSIDAGATKIDVRLKEFGSESIEVIDNGTGIIERDFEAITGKHSTSKLREFDDLQSVQTFGFRGEALSSLCQLAKVVVHTCSSGAPVGTRMEFDTNGDILARRPLARSRGTTVIVNQLFHNLPVRRRHLTDPAQLAKEFARTVNLLTAYCLISVGVQISCVRISKNGEKIPVVSNGSASSLKDNIFGVYGQSQASSLLELAPISSIPSDILDEFNVNDALEFGSISISGFITKPSTLQSADASSPSGSSKGRAASGARSTSDRQFVYVNGRPCELPRVARLVTDVWRRCSKEALAVSNDGLQMPASNASTSFPFFVLMLRMPTGTVDINLTPDKRTLLLHHERYVLALTKAILVQTLFRNSNVHLPSVQQSCSTLDQSIIVIPADCPPEHCTLSSPNLSVISRKRTPFVDDSNRWGKRAATIDFTDQRSTPLCASHKTPPKSANGVAGLGESFEIVDLLPTTETLSRQQASVHFSMSDLRAAWSTMDENRTTPITQVASQHPLDDVDLVSNGEFSLGSFRSTESDTAESELSTYFDKATFNELQIVGQFNLGFIVARHAQDLFIIDQHASDEKYRFEQLFENYRFTCQPLVAPQALELSVAQEQLLLNNLDVFAKNGFAFRVDENAPCGRQVQLVATPMLEGHIFGRSDIEEMLFVLSESCSRRCRPSRLRTILASRACRSAVMIGTALDHAKMQRDCFVCALDLSRYSSVQLPRRSFVTWEPWCILGTVLMEDQLCGIYFTLDVWVVEDEQIPNYCSRFYAHYFYTEIIFDLAFSLYIFTIPNIQQIFAAQSHFCCIL